MSARGQRLQPRGGRGPPGGAHAVGEQSRAISAAGRAAKLRVCLPEHRGSFRPAGGHSETGKSSHARSAVSGRLAARAQVDPRACVKIGLRSAQAVTVRHLRAVALRNSRRAVQPRARCATRGGAGAGAIIHGIHCRTIEPNLDLLRCWRRDQFLKELDELITDLSSGPTADSRLDLRTR